MAVMLSEEQFAALLARMTATGGGGGGGGRRRRLDFKYLKIDTLNGEPSGWGDWAFAFRRAVRTVDLQCFTLMDKVEKVSEDFQESDLNRFCENGDVTGISSELYDMLCTTVKGEALMLLKSVDEYNGFVAWSKLHQRYNPRTTARAIKLMAEVVSPGPVKSAHEVEGAISRWRSKLRVLEREYEETVGEKMKIAIVTAMLPVHIQDYVFQTVDPKMDFETLLTKIGAWVSNRVAMEGGVPMDVGEVEDQWYDEEGYYDEVAAVSAWTQCHSCHGYGHLWRDCPKKSKGKGKGKDSFGKGAYHYKGDGKAKSKGKDGGYYKGDGKGKGKDGSHYKGDGKGKGYQGTCWRCGVVGHKAAECTKWVNEVEGTTTSSQEKPVEEVSVGAGVWMIGAVEVGFTKAKKTLQGKVMKEPQGLVVKNSFEGLLDNLECDDGGYAEPDACNPKGGNGGIVGDSTGLARGTCPPEYSPGGLRGTAKAKYPCEAAEGFGTSPVAWRSSNGTPHGRSGSIGAQASIDEHMKDLYDKIGTARLWDDSGEY
jgi:hypothetical protein